MSLLTNIFVLGSYIIVALALSLGLQAFGGVEPALGWLTAAILLLFAGQVHGSLSRAQENADLMQSIAALRETLSVSERDLEGITERLEEAERRLEGKSEVRTRRLSAEMRVLENLVSRFAGGVADRSPVDGEVPAHRADITEDEAPSAAWKLATFDSANPSVYDRANDEQLLTAVRESLNENRVDLYLQPIVSLPQRRVRYFEALTRLRSESGEILMPRHYLRVAENAGLISVIDNLLLFRSVQIVRKLTESDDGVDIVCNISSESLQDREFFTPFLDFLESAEGLADRLIFEFAQDTMEMCGPLELSSLRRLAGLGFRFSMDRVSDLEFDAASLRDRGFRFVKVSSSIVTGEAGASGTPVDIAAIKATLARHGIDLIAEKIEDDRAVEAIVGAGVDFGQGYLLGEPRPAAAERLLDGTKSAVA